MKEELQNKLVEILTSMQTAVGKAADFTLTQLPDIAQQYVVYGRAASTFLVFFPFIFSAIVWIIAFRAKPGKWDDDKGPVYFGAVIVTLFPLLICFENIDQFFMTWFAPKVWLIKEIAGMLK